MSLTPSSQNMSQVYQQNLSSTKTQIQTTCSRGPVTISHADCFQSMKQTLLQKSPNTSAQKHYGQCYISKQDQKACLPQATHLQLKQAANNTAQSIWSRMSAAKCPPLNTQSHIPCCWEHTANRTGLNKLRLWNESDLSLNLGSATCWLSNFRQIIQLPSSTSPGFFILKLKKVSVLKGHCEG